ncbi:hypothetical protein HNP33_003049 [Comamonas odontotermitis]|uniref:Uncharacterized protein n=1 Tax=Comamonas odontotermitis TaxID=379895 RepID=A0ABR6RIH2_9BURK|nr:hypothetical protein [Comamonas odontotermitis]MBB6578944.1 hypothetical protein [Comamonas odontotermitis]
MAGFILNKFTGIFPRVQESLLPEAAATLAEHCDFAYGELRNMKAGFYINSMSNQPSSIWTEDGLTFYSWPGDVDAVRSPIANDLHRRLYYTGSDGFRVTDRMGTRPTGGVPGTSYKVGVPRPTTPPTIPAGGGLLLKRINKDKHNIEYRFHYESGNVKHQEGAIAVTPTFDASGNLTNARFTAPKKKVTSATTNRPTNIAGNPVTYAANGWPIFEYLDNHGLPEPDRAFLNAYYHLSPSDTWFTYTGSYFAPCAKPELENSTNNESQVPADQATPDGAFEVLRIIAKDKVTGETYLDIYTSNSSFYAAVQFVELNLVKVENQNNMFDAQMTAGAEEKDIESRAYVYTYVNQYNEEGPPSDPLTLDATPTGIVDIAATLDAVDGYVPISEIRFYRTGSGTSIASYYYTDSIFLSGQTGPKVLSFRDTKNGAELNEELNALYNYPPAQDLRNLTLLPNGILMAMRENEVHFSEAYRPWAWSPANVKPLKSQVVGACAIGTGAIITTRTQPYLVEGISPDAMTVSQLNIEQAGVNKWSIINVAGRVIYASPDGLVTIIGVQAGLGDSQVFFTREVWRARFTNGDLKNLRFGMNDGRLLAYTHDNTTTPFVIRLDEAGGTMTELPGFLAQCTFTGLMADQLYYVVGSKIYAFHAGEDQQCRWKSREMVLTRPLNFAFAQAVASGNWNIKFYADDVLTHTETITQKVTDFRLPAGFMSDRWKIEVSGQGRFRELRVAEKAKELAGL